MSYENPNQIIDTQSGQYVRDLQKTLSSVESKYSSAIGDEFDRRSKLNRQIVKDAADRSNKAYDEGITAQAKNPSIDFDGNNGLKAGVAAMNKALQVNPSKRTEQENNVIRNVAAAGTTTANYLANTATVGEDHAAALKFGLGKEQGYASDTPHLNLLNTIFATGRTTGSKKMNYDFTGRSTVLGMDVFNAKGETISPFKGIQNTDMNNLLTGNIIPVESGNIREVAESTQDILDLTNPASDVYRANLDSGNFKTVDMRKYGGGITYTVDPIMGEFDKIARPLSDAKFNGMTDKDKAVYYNDISRQPGEKPIKVKVNYDADNEDGKDWEDVQRMREAYYKLVQKDAKLMYKGMKITTVTNAQLAAQADRYKKNNSNSGSPASTSVAKDLYDEMNNDITATVGKMAGFVEGSKPIYKDNKVTAEFYVGTTKKKEKITYDLTDATDAQRFYERLSLEDQYNIFGKSKEGVQNKLDFKKIVANGTRYRESEQANDVFAAKNPGLNEKELDVKRDADVKVHLAVEGKVASLKKKYPKQSSMNTSQYVRYINTKALKEINSKTE